MLVGRRAEIGAVDRLLTDARQGRSGALVIRGEAGIGKSTLLSHARAQADDMAILSGVGVESESVLAFAGLHQLMRPAFDRIDSLPEPQAAALRAAFALSSETVDDRFRVAVGLLGLLCEVAEPQPLLVLVDDAQWLDQASREALLFAARRIQAERLAILIAARDEGVGESVFQGLPDIRLRGLSEPDARSLAATQLTGQRLQPTIEWLVRNAQGNPLALIELAASEGSGGSVPPATSVEESYVNRIRRLSTGARNVLLIAAAEQTGDRDVVTRAVAELGLAPGLLAEAETEGLVSVSPDVITFRHPLVRTAAYRSAGFTDREDAHRVLAAVLTGEADEDRRAWHRAAATVGADDEVAVELEQSAGRAQLRGGFGAAAAALVRAAELSKDDDEALRRLLLAATAAHQAGQYEFTVDIVERALNLHPDPIKRADLALVRGSVELWYGRPGKTSDMLTAAAEAVVSYDADRALRLVRAATEAGSLAGDVERIDRANAVTVGLDVDKDDQRLILTLVPRAGSFLWTGDISTGTALCRRAADLLVPDGTPADLVWRAIAAELAGDYEHSQQHYREAGARARETGALGLLLYVLNVQSLSHLYFAYVREAAETAHEALRLAADLGNEEYVGHAASVLAWVAAIQGDEDEQERLSEMASADEVRGFSLPPATLAWGRAEIALAHGRWEQALGELTPLGHFRPGFGHPVVAAATAAGLVESAVRSGHPDLAAGAVDCLHAWVEHTHPRHRQPLLERALALTADTSGDAIRHFEEALSSHERGGSPYERARTRLLYGEHLRRGRKRNEARAHLRKALQEFEELGAKPWSERASTELRAAGESVGRRDPSTTSRLTAQELQIARLVGEGGSNKEIAAQLFLSHRTVEYHLGNVYLKLGISSRAELIRDGVGPALVSVC